MAMAKAMAMAMANGHGQWPWSWPRAKGQGPWPEAMAKSGDRIAQTKTQFFCHKKMFFEELINIYALF